MTIIALTQASDNLHTPTLRARASHHLRAYAQAILRICAGGCGRWRRRPAARRWCAWWTRMRVSPAGRPRRSSQTRGSPAMPTPLRPPPVAPAGTTGRCCDVGLLHWPILRLALSSHPVATQASVAPGNTGKQPRMPVCTEGHWCPRPGSDLLWALSCMSLRGRPL